MQTTPTVDQQDAKGMLQKMLSLMGIEAKIEPCSVDDSPMLHIETSDPGRLIGKFGQTLNDLQFLLNRMLYKQSGKMGTDEPRSSRVIVDVERYRERQRDDLLKHAFQAADKVRRWGDPVELEPMNSFERRIIHRAFTSDPEIETVSAELEGENVAAPGRKRITIRLRQNQPLAPAQEKVAEE